jgi:hypothetical protein
MELVLGFAILVILIAVEPIARTIFGEVLDRWREWRRDALHSSSELDAFEIFRRSKKDAATIEILSGPSAPWVVSIAIPVDRALDLEIRRPRFSRRLRVAAGDQHIAETNLDQPDIRFDVRRAADERGEIKERIFSHAGDALTEPLARLLYHLGADAVLAKAGRLFVDVTIKDMLVERVREIVATLEAVAAAYARRPEIVGLAERYLWLEGSSPRCPYCHVDLAKDEPNLTACARCKTVHHEACFAEHGACTLLGCGCTEKLALEANPGRPEGAPR